MCWVLIEGLYTGMCTVPEKNKGGGAVSCMRVIPIDSVTPLGLPEVVSFLRFCPPTSDHRPVLITNMQLSVQVFNKKCFTFPPYVYTTGTGCVWHVYCMEPLSCRLRFSCESPFDKRISTQEDVCHCHPM